MSANSARYWHKEYSGSEGRLFDMDKTSVDSLSEQGWVDHPGKVGINLWDEGNDGYILHLKNEHEAGRVNGIGGDGGGYATRDREMELKQQEIERLQEELRRQKEATESIRTKLSLKERHKQSQEKLADHRSDANRVRVKDAGESAVDAAKIAKRQAAAKKAAETRKKNAAKKSAAKDEDPFPEL